MTNEPRESDVERDQDVAAEEREESLDESGAGDKQKEEDLFRE